MNYIELINHFWQTRRSKRITSTQADLYFFLLQESNSRDWENPFVCSNGTICASIGISDNTLLDARNGLQQRGLIEFKPGIKNVKSPVYYLKFCGNTGGKRLGNTGGNNRGNKVGNKADINTLNKTKQNKFNYKIELLKRIEDEKLVDEFLQVRKLKKLANTETALSDLVSHCKKNNFDLLEAVRWCVKKSWGGFNVKWLENSGEIKTSNQHQSQQREETIGGIKKSELAKFASQ